MKIVPISMIFVFLFLSCNEQSKTESEPEDQAEQIAVSEKYSFRTGYGDYVFQINGVYQNDSTKIEITHKGTDLDPGTFEVKMPGRLKGVFSGDVSGNYKPELYLWSRTDENNQGNALGYEFRSELFTLKIPPLTQNYANGYFGRDSFYMKQDHFIRTFPLFEEKEGVLIATENKRTLWYTLNDTGNLILIN